MAEIFTIDIQGVDYAARWFRTRSGKLVKIITPALVAGGDRIIQNLQRGYQTPGDARVYRRTGTYGRKMQKRFWANRTAVKVNVYNLTPYAKWVGVANTQAQVHRGRWPTDVQALKEEGPTIVEDVSAALIRGLH